MKSRYIYISVENKMMKRLSRGRGGVCLFPCRWPPTPWQRLDILLPPFLIWWYSCWENVIAHTQPLMIHSVNELFCLEIEKYKINNYIVIQLSLKIVIVSKLPNVRLINPTQKNRRKNISTLNSIHILMTCGGIFGFPWQRHLIELL